jgi:6-phosphofructokinase
MRNLLITMSGGTTSVINATLAGIITSAQESPHIDKIYAGFPGILGFLAGNVLDLTNTTTKQRDIITYSPGSASIGTTRTKIFTTEELEVLRDGFREYGIGYFVNIGGNGTIKQTKSIAAHIKEVRVAAAPKTVDNDLGDQECNLMWYTPGFPSCVNYWYHKIIMLNNENYGAHSHDKILIAQAFGRETGFITGAMRLADPNRKLPLVLLLPEDQQSPDKVLQRIEDTVSRHGRALVGTSEGYHVSQYKFERDLTGQPMYGSSKSTAAQQLVNLCMDNGLQARSYTPTVDQRQNFEHTLASDIRTAYWAGKEIISNFNNGESHFFQSYSKTGHQIIYLDKITDFSRTLRDDWIDRGNFDVTDEYISYLSGFTKPTPVRELFVGGNII